MNSSRQICPGCGQQKIYSTVTTSGAGHGAVLLPRLGGFFQQAKVEVQVCANCGLMRLYAEANALSKLPQATEWSPI